LEAVSGPVLTKSQSKAIYPFFLFFCVFFGCASGKKNLKKEKLKQATFPFGTNEKESSSVSFSWALFFPLPSQASC